MRFNRGSGKLRVLMLIIASCMFSSEKGFSSCLPSARVPGSGALRVLSPARHTTVRSGASFGNAGSSLTQPASDNNKRIGKKYFITGIFEVVKQKV